MKQDCFDCRYGSAIHRDRVLYCRWMRENDYPEWLTKHYTGGSVDVVIDYDEPYTIRSCSGFELRKALRARFVWLRPDQVKTQFWLAGTPEPSADAMFSELEYAPRSSDWAEISS